MVQVAVIHEDPAWAKDLPRSEDQLTAMVRAVVEFLDLDLGDEAEISLLLTNDAHIQELNRDYRNKDKPTNVLSFPTYELDPDDVQNSLPPCEAGQPLLLGDIIMALETVREEAHIQEKRFEDHVCHLLVHGVLHLLGHDHMVEDEAERMEAIEIAVLAKNGIADPYEAGLVMDD